MKTKIPYNAGEIRLLPDGKKVLIAGHIWWPVEQKNAYHCIALNKQGEPEGHPEYIWDTANGGGTWKLEGMI